MFRYRLNTDLSLYYMLSPHNQMAVSQMRAGQVNDVMREFEESLIFNRSRTVIFAGFQRISNFIQHISLYQILAVNSIDIFVFGVPDKNYPIIPNIHYIPVHLADSLADEQFFISYGRNYAAAFVAKERTTVYTPNHELLFRTMWTNSPDTVFQLYDNLSKITGLSTSIMPKPDSEQTGTSPDVSMLVSKHMDIATPFRNEDLA